MFSNQHSSDGPKFSCSPAQVTNLQPFKTREQVMGSASSQFPAQRNSLGCQQTGLLLIYKAVNREMRVGKGIRGLAARNHTSGTFISFVDKTIQAPKACKVQDMHCPSEGISPHRLLQTAQMEVYDICLQNSNI